jgi:hypothetical protein
MTAKSSHTDPFKKRIFRHGSLALLRLPRRASVLRITTLECRRAFKVAEILERSLELIRFVWNYYEQRKREIHTARPDDLKNRRSFSSTKPWKNPVFDCAVALCTIRNLSSKSSQVKLLITNNAFWIVQRATAQSKTGIFRDFGVAEALPGFQAGWSNCLYFFSLFLFI